jgi:hypothetical protein
MTRAVPKASRRGRPKRPSDVSAPPCYRGHESERVYAFRLYGALRDRVLYRCEPSDPDIKPHTFAAQLPKVRVDDGLCDACEHEFGTHDGHQSVREYTFTAREIAAGLVAVGKGLPYTRIAASVRTEADRPGSSPLNASLVANWVDVYGPVVVGALSKRDSSLPPAPHAIYLDAKSFRGNVLNDDGTKKKGGRVRFSILAAMAHAPGGQPIPLLIRATRKTMADDWATFLRELAGMFDGAPSWVISDGEYALRKAASKAWPKQTPELWSCHLHLRMNAEKRLKQVGITSIKHIAWQAAQQLTVDREHFDTFVAEAKAIGGGELLRWVDKVRPVLERQWDSQDPPRSRSTGQVESFLRLRVGQALDGRHRGMHNLARLQLLLDLISLDAHGKASVRTYTRLVRAHVNDGRGRPERMTWEGRTKFNFNKIEGTWEAPTDHPNWIN